MRNAKHRVIASNDEFVWIVDEGGELDRTVTNDAEAVVATLHPFYPGRRIMYRDSGGQWDELVHQNGVFTGFNFGGPRPPSPTSQQPRGKLSGRRL